MKLSDYRGFLDQYSRSQVASLDARMERDGGSGVEYGALVEDPAAVNPQSQTNVKEMRGHLASAISELDEQEQVVAAFYFYEGLTLKEIGKALNFTEGRISQILRNALTKLRKHLKDSPLALGNWQETFS